MKRIIRTGLAALLALSTLSCVRIMEDRPMEPSVPDGTPAMLCIGFGNTTMQDLSVSTRSEASASEEARVHDIYVMIFDNTKLSSGSPEKIYGRYFSHEHLTSDLAALDANPNEGWWVENKTMNSVTPAVDKTTGVVKVSTVTCSDATLVVLANVSNSVTTFGSDDDITYLNGITNLDELRGTEVILSQDVVQRKDLFLMVADTTVNTSQMIWGTLPQNYNENYRLKLRAVDAKVKFLVKCNEANISEAKAVYWQVCNTPNRCYLFSDYANGAAPDDVAYFDSQQAYFEGKETVDGEEWYAFTFYMFENRQPAKAHASRYHDREKQQKIDTGIPGYSGGTGGNYVKNGEWIYASPHATYVKFDLVLTLTPAGIAQIGGADVGNALTSDTIFSVHLGDFGTSGTAAGAAGYDDYNTLRSHFYTYKITINNSGSIYAEVENDIEVQPGQEGFLLLTNDEIVNADAHYEYHSITFGYNPQMNPEMFSWYVKTPFGEGGPTKAVDPDNPSAYIYNADGLDYKWVKFAVNEVVAGAYTKNRRQYPGNGAYVEGWKPSLGTDHPELMDINELIMYIFDQTSKETASPGSSDFIGDSIRVTIFIDEYYYEEDPLNPGSGADPDLWRKFVNAQPREMHILSDARQSRDRASDVILSSHSIIQQSIQSIFNTYAPGLRSAWGCEHKDEIKEKVPDGWPYWGTAGTERYGADNNLGRENGRLNTGYIWGTYGKNNASGTDVNTLDWSTFLDFEVDNKVPELREAYHGMAWSCLTRNRDNNGNGKIDRNEVRWYLASARQLIGMWVGNESLSMSARLYQPNTGQWRAHVVSSTNKMVCWSEEGGGSTPYSMETSEAWPSLEEAYKGESVRCVRNVGTYDGINGVTDISESPYTQEIDKYFTVTDNGDDSYSFLFDRLNTKSIREYSEGDLPYHSQNSLQNRVYVKFNTQRRSDEVSFSAEKIQDINPTVTAAGYNAYCPDGYRFPNHTEMVLMSLYLPDSYFKKDKDGNAYSGTKRMPTRTYYDRGLYGDLYTTTEPWKTENQKIGWALSTQDVKQHCTRINEMITNSRCIRDDGSMKGTIEGEITVETPNLYASDWAPVTLNFTSVGSAFTSASLKLCYNAHSGNYREVDIPVESTPTGLQYRKTQTIIVPSLSDLGLELGDLPRTVTLQAEVKNLAGQTKTVSRTVTLSYPLNGVEIAFPSLHDDANGVPVRVKMNVGGHSVKFSSAVLYWKESGGAWQSYSISALDPDFHRSYSEDIYLKSIIGDSDFASKSFVGKRYNYKLTVTTNDGVSFTTPVRSMEIVAYGLHPNENKVPDHPWQDPWWLENNYYNAKQWHSSLVGNAPGFNQREQRYIINDTWKIAVSDLHFQDGDAIETLMDVSDCIYYETVPTNDQYWKNRSVGMDNIFAIGKTAIDVGTVKNILFYYPAHDVSSGEDKLQIDANPSWRKKSMGTLNGELNILINKDEIYCNGNPIPRTGNDWQNEYNAAFAEVTADQTNSVYIGAEEGNHLSRALYHYIRVIREGEM